MSTEDVRSLAEKALNFGDLTDGKLMSAALAMGATAAMAAIVGHCDKRCRWYAEQGQEAVDGAPEAQLAADVVAISDLTTSVLDRYFSGQIGPEEFKELIEGIAKFEPPVIGGGREAG